MFLLTELFPLQVKESSEEGAEEGSAAAAEESAENISEAFEEVAAEEYDNIRDEVRSEMLSKMEEDSEGAGLDLKVARLKRIAKEKAVSGSGAAVRRVSD